MSIQKRFSLIILPQARQLTEELQDITMMKTDSILRLREEEINSTTRSKLLKLYQESANILRREGNILDGKYDYIISFPQDKH